MEINEATASRENANIVSNHLPSGDHVCGCFQELQIVKQSLFSIKFN